MSAVKNLRAMFEQKADTSPLIAEGLLVSPPSTGAAAFQDASSEAFLFGAEGLPCPTVLQTPLFRSLELC
ncbi:hypothetical protein Ct61P_10133 [Colletotrichum tofieldiae]|nr:hypothetical protein Ct61P_10133 [Colletotrichum tofieldiae]